MDVKSKRKAVKLLVGFIFAKEEIYFKTKHILEKEFGKSDFESIILPFNHTQYYEKELGLNLKRKFLSFARLILPENLAKIKIITNRLERRLTVKNRRQINIDPGLLCLSKLILATTKNYKHRIYLTKGIYAEVTLYYQDKNFRAWDWTYPDYKTSKYIRIFNTVRTIYSQQIKS